MTALERVLAYYRIKLDRTQNGRWSALGAPRLGGTLNGVGDTEIEAVLDLFVTANEGLGGLSAAHEERG